MKFQRLPPTGAVPRFVPEACGTPADWYGGDEELVWCTGTMKRFDAPDNPIVDFRKFIYFMDDRKLDNTWPISNLLGLPEGTYEPHRARIPWRPFSEDKLLTSRGLFGSRETDWKRAWHGTKMEVLYSILYHQKISSSEDEACGHRFLRNKPGVYCRGDEHRSKAA